MNPYRQLLLSFLEVSKIARNLQRHTRHGSLSCISIRNCNHGFQSRKLHRYQEHKSVFVFSPRINSSVKQFSTDPQYSLPPDVQSLYSMISSASHVQDRAKSRPIPVSSDTAGNIKLLYDLGMTNDEIAKCEMMRRGFIASTFIKSHVEFVKSVGLTAAEICNIMKRLPRFFTTAPSVVEDIAEYILGVGVSKKNLKHLLIFSPSVFYRVKGRPQRVGSFIQGIIQEHHPEVDRNSIIAYMLRDDIKLFHRSEKELRTNLQFLLQMGFKGPNLVKVIRYCPSALRIGTDFLQRRWDYLQWKLELDDETTIKTIIRHPRILTIAEDNMNDKFAFLYDRAKFKPQDVLKTLKVFERSATFLEKRFNILTEVKYQGNFLPIMVVPSDMFHERIEKLRAQAQQDLKNQE